MDWIKDYGKSKWILIISTTKHTDNSIKIYNSFDITIINYTLEKISPSFCLARSGAGRKSYQDIALKLGSHDKFSPFIQQIFTDTENTAVRLTVMSVI